VFDGGAVDSAESSPPRPRCRRLPGTGMPGKVVAQLMGHTAATDNGEFCATWTVFGSFRPYHL